MTKPAKYVTTPVEACNNYATTMQQPCNHSCCYRLVTGLLQACYRLYRYVTYFTYFIIKEQILLVYILLKRIKEHNFLRLYHIKPFKTISAHSELFSKFAFMIILQFFPTTLKIGGF